jgi:hypothetical protein
MAMLRIRKPERTPRRSVDGKGLCRDARPRMSKPSRARQQVALATEVNSCHYPRKS